MIMRHKFGSLFLIIVAVGTIVFMSCSMPSTQCENAPTTWRIIDGDSSYYEFYVDSTKQIFYDGGFARTTYDSEVSDIIFSDYFQFKKKYFSCCKISEFESIVLQLLQSSNVWENFEEKTMIIEPVSYAIFNPKDSFNINFEYMAQADERYKTYRGFSNKVDSSLKVNDVEPMRPIIRE